MFYLNFKKTGFVLTIFLLVAGCDFFNQHKEKKPYTLEPLTEIFAKQKTKKRIFGFYKYINNRCIGLYQSDLINKEFYQQKIKYNLESANYFRSEDAAQIKTHKLLYNDIFINCGKKTPSDMCRFKKEIDNVSEQKIKNDIEICNSFSDYYYEEKLINDHINRYEICNNYDLTNHEIYKTKKSYHTLNKITKKLEKTIIDDWQFIGNTELKFMIKLLSYNNVDFKKGDEISLYYDTLPRINRILKIEITTNKKTISLCRADFETSEILDFLNKE